MFLEEHLDLIIQIQYLHHTFQDF